MDRNTVIFDLDGTLALIDKRRDLSQKPDGKMDWDVFFDPANIALDQPNQPVIDLLQMFINRNMRIVILSGRSDVTFNATTDWLLQHGILYHQLLMRPQDKLYLPDDQLKKQWIDTDPYIDKRDIFAIFDDRQRVVDMWRANGFTTFQVADGNF